MTDRPHCFLHGCVAGILKRARPISPPRSMLACAPYFISPHTVLTCAVNYFPSASCSAGACSRYPELSPAPCVNPTGTDHDFLFSLTIRFLIILARLPRDMKITSEFSIQHRSRNVKFRGAVLFSSHKNVGDYPQNSKTGIDNLEAPVLCSIQNQRKRGAKRLRAAKKTHVAIRNDLVSGGRLVAQVLVKSGKNERGDAYESIAQGQHVNINKNKN